MKNHPKACPRCIPMLLAVFRPKAISEHGDLPRSTRVGRQVSRPTILPLPEGAGRGAGERAQPIASQYHQQLRDAQACSAFTLIELLVVLAVLALLAATLLPALAATKPKVQKITCLNNLKQVGVACRLWEAANNGRYPQAVTAHQGGAEDYCTHGGTGSSIGIAPTLAYNPGMVFIVMSNYLSPKLLFCPADYIHAGAATNISYGDLLSVFTPASGANAPALSAYAKVSYFVGADANEADPQSVLAGDCNIGNSGTTGNSPAAVRFGTTVSATSSAPEVTATAFSTSANNWAWTAADLHQGTGNLLFADGSVQSATISGLHLALQNATNTVNGPCWNFLP